MSDGNPFLPHMGKKTIMDSYIIFFKCHMLNVKSLNSDKSKNDEMLSQLLVIQSLTTG